MRLQQAREVLTSSTTRLVSTNLLQYGNHHHERKSESDFHHLMSCKMKLVRLLLMTSERAALLRHKQPLEGAVWCHRSLWIYVDDKIDEKNARPLQPRQSRGHRL